jgi:hypothetical protein
MQEPSRIHAGGESIEKEETGKSNVILDHISKML